LSQERILRWSYLRLDQSAYHGWLSMMTSSEGPFLVLPRASPTLNPPLSVTLWFCLQCSCKSVCNPDSAGFNALYYVLFCLFLSTCVLQSVCAHTTDFVSVHKQIN